jgi:uncharacterized membrane protein YgcG
MTPDIDLLLGSKTDKLMTIDIEVILKTGTIKDSVGKIRETGSKTNEATLVIIRIAKAAANQEAMMANAMMGIVETIAEIAIMAEIKACLQVDVLQVNLERLNWQATMSDLTTTSSPEVRIALSVGEGKAQTIESETRKLIMILTVTSTNSTTKIAAKSV